MKVWLTSLLLLSSMNFSVHASSEDCDETSPVPKQLKSLTAITRKVASACPNDKNLNILCSSVNLRKEDKDPNSSYVYEYERIIMEASCADIDSESNAEISKKVNAMWNKYQAQLQCKGIPTFDVTNGNILKLAVRKRFKTFLVEAAEVWKVNLNKVDESDSSTLLDYVEKEMKMNRGSQDEPRLKQYYDILRKAGAKHKSEL